ncbi:MAG: TaqI-like C-terminal specificity domain-containing protein [Bacteroidales bacterium]|nr:TaqI-like C-terminal specificity domain-containing protein [Bacteroidales bacterium]
MNTETLRQIFKSPFDYTTYSREIVHRLFGCHDVASRPEWLDTNAEGDQSFFIGQMDDADHRLLGFFYTRVADGGDVRRKRVGLRKLISPYLKYDVDGAIAVFDDGRHWRLSYICDLKEGSTSAKRFSYILGDENGQYKTPLERLEKVARLNGRLTLSDLRESFSVDALSDEFFDEYHLHYDRIVANLTQSYRRDVPWRVSADGTSDTRLHDYVKKMMGRIVFLHFLQKKGWLNGNPTFLRDLFLSSPHQADFLEQVLEPLFFGIFNTEPEQREKLFADEQWDRGLLRQWEHLPYLNGGLFERDEVDKMNIRLPASLFNDLFTFLASYNFTVDENDPDDAEIGVDPEMLGKIFESLLEDNKAKGAFYTPKEIVRYMCKESLIAYLNEQCTMNNVQLSSAIRSFVENHELPGELEPYRENLDRALREVKICDPAIGSGAFPMGLLNELWRCREAISLSPVVETQNFASPSMGPSSSTQSRAALKREIIENNIYGVDIERGAIDIARLRFWLSIVVDSEEPQALPNFDYKFMQGNSLIESFEGVDLSRMMSSDGQRSSLGKGRQKAGANQLGIEFVSTDTKRNLQLMLREYFSLTDHVKKAEARREINDSVKSYIRHQDLRSEAVARLASLDPSANQEFFLWHTWFKDIFDKGGFDIVVGNPPYINVENLEEKTKTFLFSHYTTCQGRTDIYIGFIEKAVSLMNDSGLTSFIIPYSYTNQNYGELSRRLLSENHSILEIVDTSNYYVFDNAVVKNIIIRFGKAKGDSTLIRIADNKICFEQSNFIERIVSTKSFLQLKNCRIETKPFEDILEIKEHIEKCSVRMGKIFLVAYGVRVNNKYDKEKPKSYYIYDYPMTYFKKFTEGKCINRYSFTQYGWLNYEPDEHYNPMFPELFENEKLMFINVVSKQLRFAYDNEGFYNSHTVVNCVNISKLTRSTHTTAKKAIREGDVVLAKNYSTKYVLGIINSKVMNWYFMQFQSEGLHCYPDDAKQFPIAKASKEQQQPIIELVDKILEAKCSNPTADTSALERKIDRLVYELYGLTEEEVNVIEGQ